MSTRTAPDYEHWQEQDDGSWKRSFGDKTEARLMHGQLGWHGQLLIHAGRDGQRMGMTVLYPGQQRERLTDAMRDTERAYDALRLVFHPEATE